MLDFIDLGFKSDGICNCVEVGINQSQSTEICFFDCLQRPIKTNTFLQFVETERSDYFLKVAIFVIIGDRCEKKRSATV